MEREMQNRDPRSLPSVSTRGRARGGPRSRGSRQQRTVWRLDNTGVRVNYDPRDVLEVRPPRAYSHNAEILQKPKVLGSYSINNERDFLHDRSMLRFLDAKYIPETEEIHVNLDLNKGLEKFNKYSGNAEERFLNTLRWILENKKLVVNDSTKRLNADFVSTRGNLSKLMRSPHCWDTPWTLYATEFEGSVYIINRNGDELPDQNEEECQKITKWGQIFQCYMKGGDPEEGVDENEEHRCVLKTHLGNSSLLYSLKSDCVDSGAHNEDFEDLESFVLVKLNKELETPKQQSNHRRFRLNQIWVWNQLSGIPRTLIGYRDNSGIVHTLKLIRTDELPEMCARDWNPNVFYNFLDEALKFIKDRVSRAPGVTFRFHREAGGIFCTRLLHENHVELLPSWYKEGLSSDIDNESS